MIQIILGVLMTVTFVVSSSIHFAIKHQPNLSYSRTSYCEDYLAIRRMVLEAMDLP